MYVNKTATEKKLIAEGSDSTIYQEDIQPEYGLGRFSSVAAQLIQIQKTIGNRHAQKIASASGTATSAMIQPKLYVGGENDRAELQAEQMARRAIEGQVTPNGANLQRPTGQSIVPLSLANKIEQSKEYPSQPLPIQFRRQAEDRLKANFSQVRLHQDTNAHILNSTLRAKAFTTGQHIFFSRGNYNPHTPTGQHLLLHELAHVKQQVNFAAIASQQGDVANPANIVQTFPALKEIYAGKNDLLNDDFFPKFELVQIILRSPFRVKKHLENLSAYMKRHNESARIALKGFELGRHKDQLPFLTDFVPPSVFASLVSEGSIFEDLVNPRHGAQTHRLQWFIVAQEMGDKWARDVFRESVNPRWRIKFKGEEKNMWDFIVDEVSAKLDTDFTQPEKFETYLTDWRMKGSSLRTLAQDIQQGHDTIRTDKDELRQQYPSEDNFTPKMKRILTYHKVNSQRAKGESIVKQIELKKERDTLVAQIEDETVTLPGRVKGVDKSIRWTGWIAREDSQASPDVKSQFPYFIPTVAFVR